ncbi:hypothetical protein ACFX2H_038146 [Malus domestica]
MIYLLWNCRGLGSDTTIQAIRGLIRKHRPTMIFLSETKMKDHRIGGNVEEHIIDVCFSLDDANSWVQTFWAKEKDYRDLVQKCWNLQGRSNWFDTWHYKLSILELGGQY